MPGHVRSLGLEVAERAQVSGEPARGLVQFQQHGGVVGDGLDLLAVPDQPRVAREPVDVVGSEPATFSTSKPPKASLIPGHFASTTFQLIPEVNITLLMLSR